MRHGFCTKVNLSFKSCPREGASLVGDYSDKNGEFQVMPPRGGIQHHSAQIHCLLKFQVMPPRGGIRLDNDVLQFVRVSSHAPARGHLASLFNSFC